MREPVLSRTNTMMLRVYLLFAIILGAQSQDNMAITCGSAIKIRSKDTGYELSSEEKQLGGGSGQQIVTFQNDPATQDTLWLVRPANHDDTREYWEETTCGFAEAIPCNTAIRLTHMRTQKNLHSHGVKSVMSQQQEVTAYGLGDGFGDGGDDWIVRCLAPKAKYWRRGEPFHLFHRDTMKFLGTAKSLEFNQKTCGSNCPIMGHLESFGRSTNDQHTVFVVEQGVHITPA